MRQLYFGLVLILVSALVPTSSVAETCIACRYFDALQTAGETENFSKSMSGLEIRPLAEVSLNHGAFCEAGKGALVAARLIAASDRQFTQAQLIVRKTRQCPQDCAPDVEEAAYCGYRDHLVMDRYRLGAVALRLADLADIYERADSQKKLPVEILSADMTLYGGESLNVLADALKALASGDPALLPELRWQASSTEMSGLFDAVALLVDFSLIEGDVSQLEAALESSAILLATLRGEIVMTLSDTRAMQPIEHRTMEQRILKAASDLAWLIASLQTSAEAQFLLVGEKQSAETTMAPADHDPNSMQGTVGCLNRLSRAAFAASEAPGILADTLDGCRPITGCAPGDVDRIRVETSPLRAYLKTLDEREAQTSVLIGSMCKAN